MVRRLCCHAAFLVLVVSVVVAPAVVTAQEEEAPESYIYATYFDCDASQQWLADMIVENVTAEHYDAAVDAGTIGAWGWLVHHTGGKWRRGIYHTAPTLEAVLAATVTINEAIGDEHPLAGNALISVCPSHDDYVWRRLAGSPPGSDRGEVGFSVYYVCQTDREERADELVEQVVGPIFDRHVGEGKLTSWGWNEHIVGGEYRRLATMTAADEATLVRERGAIIDEMFYGETPNEGAQEFGSICGPHQDYIWGIEHEKP